MPWHIDDQLMRHGCKPAIQPGAHTDKDLRAQNVEHALKQVQPDSQGRNGKQRRNTTAYQGTVVDLKHVKGTGQCQDIDDAGKDEQKNKQALDASQRLEGCITGLFLRLCHNEFSQLEMIGSGRVGPGRYTACPDRFS